MICASHNRPIRTPKSGHNYCLHCRVAENRERRLVNRLFAKGSKISAVYLCYRKGSRTAREVSALTGINSDDVCAFTFKLIRRGLLRRIGGVARRLSYFEPTLAGRALTVFMLSGPWLKPKAGFYVGIEPRCTSKYALRVPMQ